MTKVTDPALELAGVLEALAPPRNTKGSEYLASKFGVEVWSLEFYQIIFSIIQRIEAVRALLRSIAGFEHLIDDIDIHLDSLKAGFTTDSLQQRWDQRGASYLSREHIQPLKMCSGFLRPHVSYPDLSDEEREKVLSISRDLLGWLEKHQLEEDDFIRQALIEGLGSFIFRMERFRWLGWGYSLESLKAVVMAYVALERGDLGEPKRPKRTAAIKRIGGGLKRVFEIVGVSKDVVERADFALKAYGALMIAVQSRQTIAGLLQ
jgi:hypothetical protein